MKRSRMVCVAALVLALAACSRKSAEAPAAPAPSATGGQGTAEPVAAPVDDAKVLAAVPGTAAAVLVLDTAVVTQRWLPVMLGIPAGSAEAKALWADFAEVTKRRLGVDVASAGPVVAFVDVPRKAAGLILLGVTAAGAKAPKAGEHEGVALLDLSDLNRGLSAAEVAGGLVVGTEPAVRAAIDAAKGKTPAADKAEPAAALRDTLAALGAAPVRIAADVAAIGVPVHEQLGVPPIATAGVALAASPDGDQAIRAVVTGKKDDLAALETMVRKLLAEGKKQLTEQRQSVRTDGGYGEEALLLLADHAQRASERNLKIRNEGTTLHASYETGSFVVMAAPVLAAVAVPAFIKYTRRAKTTEAIDNLDKLYKGAAVYFTVPRVNPDGTRAPCAFPPTTELAPAGSPCDHPDDRYPLAPEAWAGPTWAALSFEVNDPHYFRYRFESSGTGADAQFTASAYGDLDCDGVWSTFQRVGTGTVDDGDCSLDGNPSFYVENETE